MSEIASLYAAVDADVSGFQKGMGVVKSLLGDMGGLIGGLSFVGLFTGAVKSAAEFEKASNQLNNVLNSTGGIAGVTRDAALKLASTFAEETTFSDDAVLSAENLMLTFTNVGNDVFPTATAAALDMSVAMGQDLKSSVIQIGKALNDPLKGFSALQRVGVTFSESQKHQIQNFMATNQLAKAQGIILQELQREFGDSAFAAGGTLDGALKQLRNTFEELLQGIGMQFLPMLTSLVKWLREVVTSISNANPGFLAFIMVLGLAAAAIGPLGAVLAMLLSPIALVVGAVAGLYLAWQNNFGGIRTTVMSVVNDVKPYLDQLGADIGGIFGTLAAGPKAATTSQGLNRWAKNTGEGKEATADIKVGQASADQNQSEWAQKLKIQILTALADLGKMGAELNAALAPIGKAIIEALGEAVSALATTFGPQILGFIQDGLTNAAKGAQATLTGAGDVGKALVQKVIDGIKDLDTRIKEGVTAFIQQGLTQAAKGAQDFLGGAGAIATAIAGRILDGLLHIGADIMTAIGNGLTNAAVGAQAFLAGAGALGKAIMSKIGDAASGAWNDLTGTFDFLGGIKSALQGVWDWLKGDGLTLATGAFGSLIGAVSAMWGSVKAAIIKAVADGLAAIADIVGAIPGGAGIAVQIKTALAPFRDSGGPVTGGQAYQVGVAELFIPKSSGTAVPLSKLAGAGAGGGNITVNLTANGVSDPARLVQMIDRELNRRNRPKIGVA